MLDRVVVVTSSDAGRGCMEASSKSSWLGMLREPVVKMAPYAVTMPFRDITQGRAAAPSDAYRELVHHYSNVYRKAEASSKPIIYPTSDTYLVFCRTGHECRAVLTGPRSLPRVGEYVTDDTEYLVVSLSYKGSYALLPVLQYELTDKSFNLTDIFPGWARELTEKICQAPDIKSKAGLFENFLCRQADKLAECKNEFVHVINTISKIDSNEAYLKCIKTMGYTERHIRRIFLKYTGVSPYKYTRIIRCQAAVHAMRSNPKASVADIAFELNYCDQSHFAKEFKLFYDLTPTEFIREFAQ